MYTYTYVIYTYIYTYICVCYRHMVHKPGFGWVFILRWAPE